MICGKEVSAVATTQNLRDKYAFEDGQGKGHGLSTAVPFCCRKTLTVLLPAVVAAAYSPGPMLQGPDAPPLSGCIVLRKG